MAHQQGAAGAISILQNPDADLASIVGQQEAALNAGAGKTTAQHMEEFTNRYLNGV